MCGAKGSKAPFHGKRQVGAAENFCVAAHMRGRTSGYRKVAVKVGPAGQTDGRHGRAATRASAPTEQAQSSTALESFHSMTVSELRALLSQRGLSNVGAKKDLVERLATVAAGAMEEAQEERHAGAFQDSSPTSLDTAAFSMAAAEESTPVDSTMMRLAGDGNDNVCLDTAATTIAAAEEIRLVCFVAATEAAGKDGTGDGVDTVATKDVAGETGTLRCSEMTENSTAVSNPIILIPIGLDTVAISTAAGETGIGGYAGAAESFPAADNTREHQHAAKNSAELSAVAGHDIHPPSSDTAAISTAAGETSIGGYNHVVGSFSATDKGSALSSAADADDSMEHAAATVLTPKSSVRAPGGSGEGETSMFTTSGKDLLGQRLRRGVVIRWKDWWYIW